MNTSACILLACLLAGFVQSACGQVAQKPPVPYLIILGTIQDGGSPHIGCDRECCSGLFTEPDPDRMVVSLGLIDPVAEKRYLFEATPDMTRQLHRLNEEAPYGDGKTADGIFLTHAHIGHYTGLMYLGREALNSNNVPVYTMPSMKEFLESNGPWGQLVSLNNIKLIPINHDVPVELGEGLSVTPFLVPHRDEYSETVGFRITGPNKSALFIPDIDKWHKWEKDISEVIKEVDYAFIDGSFYDAEEISYRDVSEIPHPFIFESMETLKNLSASDKAKVYFIHFNHTNPVIDAESDARKAVLEAGFRVAELGTGFEL
ncbi:MBL fold metallo-hydrolase [Fulvivirga sedimenti]|uniref:MBL fold metallo-hydrolase n=1 Tax=Fulvivirga sedimenti TaxID=2879465 RepID=A0A9X1HUZ8_9BACT|nr:MBL fold metallo-hydrolase [Fulvivirga sedimenti]MCA6074987.1 MBL fold metallo-hydrolase [Fulvivirga sedimenti]MCA6076164.1 MBL fold metallo-hydrolase [Fulvivirga sedimenti]MCA6077292.1 MBL fold metallo-hydrolase [Fulvivirga sedimenti]